MRNLAPAALLSLGLAAVPASATEVGLLLDKQFGKSVVIEGIGSVDSAKPTGVGIRGAFSVLDLKVAELGIAATYHPDAKSDVTVAGHSGKIGYGYWAVGAQVDWKFFVNLHVGLDLRGDKITTEVPGDTSSTTYTRPWAKAGFGFSIPMPVVSPFFRLEAAVPLVKSSSLGSADEVRKSIAPEFQIGLYGGIRF